MAQKKEDFTVQYKDQKCKQYAIAVLNAIDFVAENDERRGSLERNVTVYAAATAGSRDFEIAEKILNIFASTVNKVARTLTFKVKFNKNAERKAIHEVKNLIGVDSADIKRVRDTEISRYANAPLTLEVVGLVDPQTVWTTLRKYGTAHISS